MVYQGDCYLIGFCLASVLRDVDFDLGLTMLAIMSQRRSSSCVVVSAIRVLSSRATSDVDEDLRHLFR